ncbi:hypothetical protein [Parendozoicomonas sp. Alg238-R29]|uniref:hypothetical protein n=1 Tax=Parendozoicomonas sp. Alg238-R29 TaxID=2993446 RepID=UPI00248DA1B3|nr:hypothetical protein [Parendozoicomonas sp. Alg238-R29]
MEYVKKFLRNLQQHIDLIDALHRNFGSLSFSSREFIDVARNCIKEKSEEHSNPELTELFTRLCQLEILIPVARAENQFDLNPTILDIVELITDQQQLGLSVSLKAKIDDLHRLTKQLGQALSAKDNYLVVRYTSQLDRRFRDVHRELKNNEQAILRIIEDAKNSSRSIPLKARYTQALDAWTQYVQPTADMLDVQGEYERTLKAIEHNLLDYMEQARHNIGYSESTRLARLNLRLLDLRSGLRHSIDRCSRLLEPIYRRFQRNSALTRGAAIAIAEMRRKKFRYAISPTKVPLTGRTRPNLTDSNSSLVAYLSELTALESRQFDIPDAIEQEEEQPVTFSMVNQDIQPALPVNDCLAWLIEHYPTLNTRQLLEFLVRLTNETENLNSQVISGSSNRYETRDHFLTMERRTLALESS